MTHASRSEGFIELPNGSRIFYRRSGKGEPVVL